MSTLNDLEIIDAHFHQWNPANTPHGLRPLTKLFGWNKQLYHWVSERAMPKPLVKSLGGVSLICEPYLPKDYQEDIKGHNVKAAVFTPYSWKVKSDLELADETKYVERLFAEKPASVEVELGAIIGNAHLENVKDLPGLLDNHQQASPCFVGIRDMLDWSDNPNIASLAKQPAMSKNREWLKGFEILAQTDLLFDAFVFHHRTVRPGSLYVWVPLCTG